MLLSRKESIFRILLPISFLDKIDGIISGLNLPADFLASLRFQSWLGREDGAWGKHFFFRQGGKGVPALGLAPLVLEFGEKMLLLSNKKISILRVFFTISLFDKGNRFLSGDDLFMDHPALFQSPAGFDGIPGMV